MADVMKAMGGGAKRGPMAGLAQHARLRRRHAEPGADAEARREDAGRPAGNARHAGRGLPPSMPGLPPTMPGLPPKFPGGLPGLGGTEAAAADLPGLREEEMTSRFGTTIDESIDERKSECP